MMIPYPIQLERLSADAIRIVWNDGFEQHVSSRQLRDHCPCATCREKHGASASSPAVLPILSPEELRPLQVETMRPVGNYAYAITFSDGHKNGIYTFELLREIAAGKQGAE